jgi:hypothetical protein
MSHRRVLVLVLCTGLAAGPALADVARVTAANANPCILAYWHHPVYNVGQEPPATYMSAMWSLLAQHGTTLVVNGHDHTYQRYAPLDGNGNPSPSGIASSRRPGRARAPT